MGKLKEYYIDEINEPFEWFGEVDDMNMDDYMRTSGDTLYAIAGEIPKLLEIEIED